MCCATNCSCIYYTWCLRQEIHLKGISWHCNCKTLYYHSYHAMGLLENVNGVFVFSFGENTKGCTFLIKILSVGLSCLLTCPDPPPLTILLQSLVPAIAVTPILCALSMVSMSRPLSGANTRILPSFHASRERKPCLIEQEHSLDSMCKVSNLC